MSASPFRPMSPSLSPSRGQQSKLNDIRSKIIRSNMDLQQPLSALKAASLKHGSPAYASMGKLDHSVGQNTSSKITTLPAPPRASKEPQIEWKHPDLDKIEHRMVNKELELKRVLLNFIFLLVSNLAFNVSKFAVMKLELNLDLDSYTNYLHLLQLLFIWNIGSGIYKVLKPQDDFQDLNLTPQQRELLGLTPIPLKINTTAVSQKPSKPLELGKTTKTAMSTTTTTAPVEEKRVKTPIASPMASSPLKKLTHLSPRKSPLKFEQTATTTTSTTASAPLTTNPLLTKIKQSTAVSTPTYIPSPKYYYRMDSPTKAKRRV